MANEFIAELKMIGILWIVVVGYIISGTASGCFVRHEEFDIKKFLSGIAKSIIACGNLIIIAYILTIIDLSSLGFNSSTIINSGIIVYCAKILKNSLYLLGITKDGKESAKSGSILSSIDDLDEEDEEVSKENSNEEDFLDYDIQDIDINENTNGSVG